MIGAIPNPKKNFQVSKPIDEVQESVKYIPFLTTKYKLFKANNTLNQYTFEAYEFLSLGVYIDIVLMRTNENITEISIEVRRKVGSFNQGVEVTNANTHLETITDLISKSIEADPNQRQEHILQIEREKAEKEQALIDRKEEIRLRTEEEKQNNPGKYYTKQVLYLIATIVLIGGFLWIVYKKFIS